MAVTAVVGEVVEDDSNGVAEGKGDEVDDGPSVGVRGGGDGGWRKRRGAKRGRRGAGDQAKVWGRGVRTCIHFTH